MALQGLERMNASIRLGAYARKYKGEAKIASGTELYSNVRGLQKIIKTSSSYTNNLYIYKRSYEYFCW